MVQSKKNKCINSLTKLIEVHSDQFCSVQESDDKKLLKCAVFVLMDLMSFRGQRLEHVVVWMTLFWEAQFKVQRVQMYWSEGTTNDVWGHGNNPPGVLPDATDWTSIRQWWMHFLSCLQKYRFLCVFFDDVSSNFKEFLTLEPWNVNDSVKVIGRSLY